MNRWELLLLALALWSALGVVGSLISLGRGERKKARRGALWIVGVWVVYLGAELAVAKTQGQRTIALRQSKCFDEMCFSIAEVEELPSYSGRNATGDGAKLLRVSILIENKGRSRPQSEGLLRAYLLDSSGRAWFQLPGLGGVALTATVPAGVIVVGQPVFKVPMDAVNLRLVLTRGHSQPGVLVIGDSDSLGHRPDVFDLASR